MWAKNLSDKKELKIWFTSDLTFKISFSYEFPVNKKKPLKKACKLFDWINVFHFLVRAKLRKTTDKSPLLLDMGVLFIVRIFVIHSLFWIFPIIEIPWYIPPYADRRQKLIHQHTLNWQMSTNDNNNLHLFRNNKNYAQIYDTDVNAVVEITATATTITTLPMAASGKIAC